MVLYYHRRRADILTEADYFAKNSFTLSASTSSSLNIYAPVLGDLSIRMHLTILLAPDLALKVATAFFAINYNPPKFI